MSEIVRQYGESQLDYLWTHFGNYQVSTDASGTSSDNIILTESAILDLINDNTSAGIVSLTYRKHPTKEDIMQLIGTAANGSTLSIVEIPAEVHVKTFTTRAVTQKDINNGCTIAAGTIVLSLTLTNGTEFLVDINGILKQFNKMSISGMETASIHTDVNKGLIVSNLKIDKPNDLNSLVKLKVTNNGVYAALYLSKTNYGIELVKEEDGLAVRIPFNGSYLRFVSTTSDEYALISEKDPTTIYFLTDLPYIYLNGVRYGANIDSGESSIISIDYDVNNMILTYKTTNGDTISISLGPANETTPGMMSVETYIDIQNLKNIVGNVSNVEDYVQEQVNQAGFSLQYGEESNDTKPLNLINGNGDIISSVDIDIENYLQFAENKIADVTDVEESKNTVTEGHQILILTLTSGDKVYVDLNALVDIYSGTQTNSITTSVTSGVISADLNISPDDQMLSIESDGLHSYLQLVREQGKLIFYGKTQNEEDKITEINLPDALVKYTLLNEATEDDFQQYPPSKVNGEDYDQYSNPIIFGDPYLVLTFGQDSNYTIDSYSYNDWISIATLVTVGIRLSTNEGNTLTKDENGYLFNAMNWIEA